MRTSNRFHSAWVPAGLIALSLVPALAGTFRLVQLGTGAEITADNTRFFESPLPVVAHIVSAVLYCLLGAFQFSGAIRRRHPTWHKRAGRILVPAGLVSAVSGLWMSHFYPWPEFDGTALYLTRLLAGSAMILFLCLGLAAILKRDIARHRACMIRAYAIALGAGTQVFTHIPWALFPDIHGELTRTLMMGAGWGINMAVAEWIIARQLPTRSHEPTSSFKHPVSG